MKTKIIFILLLSLLFINLYCWTWPLSNSSTQDTFTSAFGPRDESPNPGLQYDFHDGMDLQAAEDTPVHAAHSGWVHASYGPSGNEGNLISTN